MPGTAAAPVPVLVPPGNVWTAWNQQFCVQAIGTTATNMVVWANWIQNGTTTTVPVPVLVPGSGAVWQNWNQLYTTGITVPAAFRPVAETTAQRAEREQRQAQATLRARQASEVRAKANDRARELLLSLLTPGQAATYATHGWFEVRGKSGRRWRIRDRGQSGNVDLMPEIGDEREATFCAHPPGNLPAADAHLAQLLYLVTDDEEFLTVANVHWRRPGARTA